METFQCKAFNNNVHNYHCSKVDIFVVTMDAVTRQSCRFETCSLERKANEKGSANRKNAHQIFAYNLYEATKNVNFHSSMLRNRRTIHVHIIFGYTSE